MKTTDWFAPYVTTAKDSGLIEGYSDGSFKPENRITRAEACTIVNRVLGRKPSKNHMKISGRIDWPDCTTADWFYEAIMEATNSQPPTRWETWSDKLAAPTGRRWKRSGAGPTADINAEDAPPGGTPSAFPVPANCNELPAMNWEKDGRTKKLPKIIDKASVSKKSFRHVACGFPNFKKFGKPFD